MCENGWTVQDIMIKFAENGELNSTCEKCSNLQNNNGICTCKIVEDFVYDRWEGK